jgi:hypothetical protein
LYSLFSRLKSRGRQLKKVKKEFFFLGLSFLLFSSFSRHSPKVDKVVFFLPRFFSFDQGFCLLLYVFNFFNFLVEKKNFLSFCLAGGGIKAGLSEQYITEIYKIGTAELTNGCLIQH